MEHWKLLWEYQNADMELESFERKCKDTPTRKKLVKLQRFVQASQLKLAEMENNFRIQQNKISELQIQDRALRADLEDLRKDMGYMNECDDEELDEKEVAALVKNCEKTHEAIVGVKKHLSQIKQEIEQSDKQLKELLQKMVAAKNEYDVLRQEHNKELEASADDIAALKAKMQEAEAKVLPELVAEYKRIKGFRPNPVALLEDNRCSGCRMQLPSGVASQVANSKKPITCENCGRILILL